MVSVIIPMAGSGTRCKLNNNKALELINGIPMFMYSVNKFKEYNFEIILSIRQEDKENILKYVNDVKIVIGGSTRALSVYNALKECRYDYVLIHDAARPFISNDIIDEIIKNKYDAFYVGLNIYDTVRELETNKIINRENIIKAQTPQGGKKELLLNSFKNSDLNSVTDDIQIITNNSNVKINLIKGNELNYKVTTPYDLKLAKLIAKEKLYD